MKLNNEQVTQLEQVIDHQVDREIKQHDEQITEPKKLTKQEKKEKRKLYKQNLKANKKYIKNKTINKTLAKQSPLDDKLCIQAQQIWKIVAYKDKRYDLIKGIDLDIYKGDFMMVFGHSGSGKTTLLSLLSALDRPSEGNVNILGFNTSTLKINQLVKLRNRFIGYVFQQYGLLKEVSVLENIIITLNPKQQHEILKLNHKYQKQAMKITKEFETIAKVYKSSMREDYYFLLDQAINYFYYYLNPINEQFNVLSLINQYLNITTKLKQTLQNLRDTIFKDIFVYEMMKKLEIDHLLNYKINMLSGGQQQRVSICRAIVKKPQILFADEPTGAVDAKTAKIIMEIFIWLNLTYNTTIVIVTHNDNLINLSNHIVCIENGLVTKNEFHYPLSIDEIKFE